MAHLSFKCMAKRILLRAASETNRPNLMTVQLPASGPPITLHPCKKTPQESSIRDKVQILSNCRKLTVRHLKDYKRKKKLGIWKFRSFDLGERITKFFQTWIPWVIWRTLVSLQRIQTSARARNHGTSPHKIWLKVIKIENIRPLTESWGNTQHRTNTDKYSRCQHPDSCFNLRNQYGAPCLARPFASL